MPKNYGVITEQGYPMSNGLGYKPLNEEDKDQIDKDKDKEKDK
jgi:hypothetical protein